MSDHQFPVSVVLYETDGIWLAQGLEYDIVARGASPDDASKNFNQKFGAELIMSMELGDNPPLSGVPRAPKEFWEKYDAINKSVEVVDSQIDVGDGHVSLVQKKMKIAA